ncbi:MAG: clan AA aspartic protease [Candidatus Latescibacteria bacterium]|nr:clan AA aspartic protease [Candidatus Latescibacterota bacterium]
MAQGIVRKGYEITLSIDLLSQNQRHPVEAVMDTGFNGYLTLPADTVQKLELKFAGNRRAILGDGRMVVFDVYLANVLWHGQGREVLAFQSEGGALLGMALLAGSRVTFDAVENGAMSVEPLPGSMQA